MVCSVEECPGKTLAQGVCSKHYSRMRRLGSANSPVKSYEKHGLHHTQEWKCWKQMKARCYNTKHDNYAHYGGRGITICDRWRTSFLAFYEDLGPKPSTDHSLDRKDVNGNYELENCQWATQSWQIFNREPTSRNTSGCAGVCFDKSIDLWKARINVNKKVIYIGSFKKLNDAVKARKEAEETYWGKVDVTHS